MELIEDNIHGYFDLKYSLQDLFGIEIDLLEEQTDHKESLTEKENG